MQNFFLSNQYGIEAINLIYCLKLKFYYVCNSNQPPYLSIAALLDCKIVNNFLYLVYTVYCMTLDIVNKKKQNNSENISLI